MDPNDDKHISICPVVQQSLNISVYKFVYVPEMSLTKYHGHRKRSSYTWWHWSDVMKSFKTFTYFYLREK